MNEATASITAAVYFSRPCPDNDWLTAPWRTARSIPRPRPQVRGIYLFRSLAGAAGFGCMVERAVAGGGTFSLFRLGFFGSRPLRF